MTKQFIALLSERDVAILKMMMPSLMFSEVTGVTLAGNEEHTLIAAITKKEETTDIPNDPVEPLPQN